MTLLEKSFALPINKSFDEFLHHSICAFERSFPKKKRVIVVFSIAPINDALHAIVIRRFR
jgi:hypothetical protein